MKLKPEYKIREIAGEKIVIMQNECHADMTRIVSLNPTAAWLWENLAGRDFTVTDIAALLTERFETDPSTALHDAQDWANQLIACHILEP